MKDFYDRISSSAPINKQAAMSAAKGFHFDNSDMVKDNRIHKFEPLPTTPVKKTHKNNPSFTDLTGRKIGRLTVIGLSVPMRDSDKADSGRWVVRCACGAYEHRRSKVLKKENSLHMCMACQQMERLKRK